MCCIVSLNNPEDMQLELPEFILQNVPIGASYSDELRADEIMDNLAQ